MAEIIDLADIKPSYIVKKIKKGAVFIYPTDTIYGLGCDATNSEAVMRIREIKQRSDKPFSVIAPSKQWILKNFKAHKSYIDKLPGPFTYVMQAKKSNLVCAEVAGDTIGVRIPKHPLTKVIQKANVPFVTTSVNVAGEKPYLEIKKIPRSIKNNVDIIIDGGKLDKAPSTVLDLTGKLPKILR